MLIDRTGSPAAGALSKGKAIAEYASNGAVSNRSAESSLPDDSVSTSQIAVLGQTLRSLEGSRDQRVEQLRLSFAASGDHAVDTELLADKLADRVLSGNE